MKKQEIIILGVDIENDLIEHRKCDRTQAGVE